MQPRRTAFGDEDGRRGTRARRTRQRIAGPVELALLWVGIAMAAHALAAHAAACPGDCDANGAVTIDELVTGVGQALGDPPVTACPAFDLNADGAVTIDELIGAVNAALNGCPGSGAVPVVVAPPSRNSGLPPVADFNDDEIPDLAVANVEGNSIWIFLGTGAGFPPTPSQVLLGTPTNPLRSPQGIALGDFNNDDVTDIAASNFDGASVSVFLGVKEASTGRGDGRFQPPTNVAVLPNPRGLAVGRFRGPAANLDLAVVGATNTTTGKVSILLGNGDGTFQTKKDFLVGDHPRNIVVGDVGSATKKSTADGIQDIVVTVAGRDDAVSIIYGSGNPDSLFSTPVKLAADSGPDGIALADLNTDGCQDIAVANNGTPADGIAIEQVSVLFGRCRGEPGDSFGGVGGAVRLAPDANPSGITVAQLDGDARLDLAVTQMGGTFSLQKVALLFNRTSAGSGVPDFTTVGTLLCDAGETPTGIAAGDFNGDAIDDLAVVNREGNDTSVLLGTGTLLACPLPVQLGDE